MHILPLFAKENARPSLKQIKPRRFRRGENGRFKDLDTTNMHILPSFTKENAKSCLKQIKPSCLVEAKRPFERNGHDENAFFTVIYKGKRKVLPEPYVSPRRNDHSKLDPGLFIVFYEENAEP